MSSTGILIILLAVFLLLNADKLAWVFMGRLKLNTITEGGFSGQLPGPPGGGRGNR